MRPERKVLNFLQDILDAMTRAEKFLTGVDFEHFAANDEKVYAVVRALEIVGEASRSLPKSIRGRYAAIPWREMSGMRDILIHDYPDVNLTVVWRTVKEDIPRLRPLITDMFAELSQEQHGAEA
jgi:uncharacterized protein with HEPN domain